MILKLSKLEIRWGLKFLNDFTKFIKGQCRVKIPNLFSFCKNYVKSSFYFLPKYLLNAKSDLISRFFFLNENVLSFNILCTQPVWKFENISTTHILREMNFSASEFWFWWIIVIFEGWNGWNVPKIKSRSSKNAKKGTFTTKTPEIDFT